MACEDLLTPEKLTEAYKSADSINEFVESPNDTLITPQGQVKTTLTGLENLVGAEHGEWQNKVNVTYVSDNSFKIPSDYSDKYTVGRRVNIDSGTAYSTITSVSFDGTDTTVIIKESLVTPTTQYVESSIVSPNSVPITTVPATKFQSLNEVALFDLSALSTGTIVTTDSYYADTELTLDMPSGVGGARYKIHPIGTTIRALVDTVMADSRVAVLQVDGSGVLCLYQAGGKRDTGKVFDNHSHILAAWTAANNVRIPGGYFPLSQKLTFPSNSLTLSGENYGRFTSKQSSLVPTDSWTCTNEDITPFNGSTFTASFEPEDVIVNYRQLSQEVAGLEEWTYSGGIVSLKTAVTTADIVQIVANNVLIDINENGSNSGVEGGQYNHIERLLFRLGTDWQSDADNRKYLTAVKGWHVREGTTLEQCNFRRCGIPFSIQGYITYTKKLDVNECYIGPMMDNTFSGSLDDFNLLDCYRNWGRLRRCTVHNSVWQQSPAVGSLKDDKGVTCHLNVVFTGYYYTEGGARQVWCEADPVSGKHEDVIIENGLLGFCQLAAGGYGSSNFRVTAGTKFRFRGKNGSIALKSYVCDGSPESADSLTFDFINESEITGNSKIFASGKTNPATKNLYIKNVLGVQSRVKYDNEINYARLTLTSTSQVATIFNLAEHASRIGGRIEIKAEGPSAYDVYDVYFGYSTEGAFKLNVVERVRNTGVAGIVVDTSDGTKIKLHTATAGTYRISYKCSAFGFIEMKGPIIA